MDDEHSDRVLLRVTMCGLRYAGVDVRPILKVSTTSLYVMRCSTGSQYSSSSSGLACDRLGAWITILAALFCTRCSFCTVLDGVPLSIAVVAPGEDQATCKRLS